MLLDSTIAIDPIIHEGFVKGVAAKNLKAEKKT